MHLATVQSASRQQLGLRLLALNLLRVCSLSELVLLGELVVRRLRGTLRRFRLCKERREVRLRNLSQAAYLTSKV